MPLRGVCTSTTDGSSGTGGTATLTFPAGTTVGDVFYGLVTLNAASGTASAAAGGTSWPVSSAGPNNQSNVLLSNIWVRVLTSGDVAAGSVVVTQSSGRINAGGAVMTGVGDAGTIGYAGAAASTLTLPTVTTTVANADIGVLVASRVLSGTAAVATYPAGWTKDNTSTTVNGSGVNFSNSSGHRTTPGAAGSYGGGTVSTSPAASHVIAYLIPFTAPTAPTSAGTGAGSTTRTGAAAGTSTRNGAASGSRTWTGTASGACTPKASGTGATSYAGTASGTAPVVGSKTGAASGSTVHTSAASGTRTPKASAAGATSYVGTATGAAPVVGSKTGTATGSTARTGAASGRMVPKGTVSGATVWVGAATGSTPTRGTAAGVTAWTGAATGAALGASDYRDIDVTAALAPRNVSAGLAVRAMSASLAPRRTTASLEDQ